MDQKRSIAALLACLVAACGGGGDGESTPPPPDPNAAERVGRGSLTIEGPTAGSTYSTESESVRLSGSAFISPTHSRCCSGSAEDTGVTVTSSTGSAVFQSAGYCQPFGFGPPTVCDHTWETRINLAVGTTTVTITARDPSGNIGRDSITITRLPDRTAPEIDAIGPGRDAINMPVNTSTRVIFSERMDAASITTATFLMTDSNGNRVVGTVAAAGTSATFTPVSALSGFTTYTATITTGARDEAGNALAAAFEWQFRTGAVPDTTPPSVVSVSPPDGTSCTGPDAVITASFSESINRATVNAETFNVVGVASNTPVPGSISTGFASLVFTPSLGLSSSTQYRATLSSGIRDLAGNAMSADHIWTFSTVPSAIGAWGQTSIAPSLERLFHSAVWTGTEMIIWGGSNSVGLLQDGGRYRPATNSWARMTEIGAPERRAQHAAVWTGAEMIVWSGAGQQVLFNGGRYEPVSDTWRSMSSAGATAVGPVLWTGSEMLVFGQGAARYDPASDSWRPISAPPMLLGLSGHSIVWTGTRMIVWGGERSGLLNAGAAYDPAADTWEVLNANGSPSPRRGHSGIWTGSEMLIWGGEDSAGAALNTGAAYNPRTNTWRPMSTCGAAAKSGHYTVWTGSEMIVWGGTRTTGQLYDVATDAWRQMSTLNSPLAALGLSAVWAGNQMLIWGGASSIGARYQP
jgi:N-acetylneuraminic acid mutarotase